MLDKVKNFPHFPGWRLIGGYPEGDPDCVGSWLLAHEGEALLLEIPEELPVAAVEQAVNDLQVTLRYVTASHEHWDHLDQGVWDALVVAFPKTEFIHPADVVGDRLLEVGGEAVWLIQAPKHSWCDVVTVFRGVAMTGDIETMTLASVNNEVPMRTKKKSFRWLREFQERAGYRIHTTVSAHLNSVRRNVDWPTLFTVES